jgi:molybdopterin/thiamine biosynthesis adenylyltransferase
MNRCQFAWRPLLLDAAEAHREGWISYDERGWVTISHGALPRELRVAPEQQYPCVLPSLLALDKALSSASNSPLASSGQTLRGAFEAEYHGYLAGLSRERAGSTWEPDYGSYVYDIRAGDLYLVAPAFWHRLALLTSNAKLLSDPAGKLSAEQIRDRLGSTVVGFVGASLGSNVIEGVVREMRPRTAKLADPDYLEITNLNRLQHGSLRYLTRSRASRRDPRDAFETSFVNKAELVAYENQLIDPYTDWYLYQEGVNSRNLDEFLLGNGQEPRLDYVVEGADELGIKVEVRARARQHGIPVLMASDFGHRGQVQLQDYAANPDGTLGYRVPDEVLLHALERCKSSGDRADLFEFVRALAGDDFEVDEFALWMRQSGEQPTSSVPQSGAVAQLSGALAGKLLALHRLGHEPSERVIVDMCRLQMLVG